MQCEDCSLPLIPRGGGVLHNFQYREVHANIWGLKFHLNQYLGSVNYKIDKNSVFRVHKSEKGRIVEFGAGLQNIGLNIWGSPKTISSIFGSQQGNTGMDPPVLKVREYPPPLGL